MQKSHSLMVRKYAGSLHHERFPAELSLLLPRDGFQFCCSLLQFWAYLILSLVLLDFIMHTSANKRTVPLFSSKRVVDFPGAGDVFFPVYRCIFMLPFAALLFCHKQLWYLILFICIIVNILSTITPLHVLASYKRVVDFPGAGDVFFPVYRCIFMLPFAALLFCHTHVCREACGFESHLWHHKGLY